MIPDEHKIDNESLDFAYERMRDFLLVTKSRPDDEKYEAGRIFASALGMDVAARDYLCEQLSKIVPDEIVHWIMLGSLVGLLIAEKEHERPTPE